MQERQSEDSTHNADQADTPPPDTRDGKIHALVDRHDDERDEPQRSPDRHGGNRGLITRTRLRRHDSSADKYGALPRLSSVDPRTRRILTLAVLIVAVAAVFVAAVVSR